MIVIRKHKGRSGLSVYGWRVYRVSEVNPGRTVNTQLGKYRSQDEARRAAEHYRANDARVAAVDAARKGFTTA